MSNEEYIEKKEKNKLDLLPKSSMILDVCKKSFNDHKIIDKKYFTTDFMNYYDPIGFSIYKSHYKYNDEFEGRPEFINNNFLRGVSQNLDDVRKYLFGSLVLFKNNELIGYWILRGSEPLKEIFGNFYDDNIWEKIEMNLTNMEEFNQAFYKDKICDKDISLSYIFL